MSSTIIQTVDILANVLIIFFLMKLLVNPREFYFNSALRPVDAVTEPILKKLRKFIHPTQYGLDYTPLIAIICLVIIRLGAFWILTDFGFVQAIVISLQGISRFLLSFFSFSVFVLLMVPVYTRNPLSSFLKTIVKPFERPFRSISQNSKSPSLLGAMFIIILLATLFFNISSSFLMPDSGAILANWHSWAKTGIDMVIIAISIYKFIVLLLIAAVVLSWIGAEVRNPLINLVYILTEPILLPIRRIIPPAGGLDLTPWVACLVIGFLGRFLSGLLMNFKHMIG
ncbi:YggT family protein [bacterium]|nr:YggT family protein [bacterium]